MTVFETYVKNLFFFEIMLIFVQLNAQMKNSTCIGMTF